jgi:DNA polymerase-3 subunit gamma/tau
VPAPAAAEPAHVAAHSTESHPPGVLDAAAVRRVWDDEILTTVRRKKPRVAALMREATVRDVQGNTLVLLFRHSVHAEMLSKSPEVLTEAITEVFGGTWQVRCEVGGGPAGASRNAGTPRSVTGPAQPPSQVSDAAPGHPTASPRAARPAAGPRASDSTDGGDDGWPTPARPGSKTPPAAAGPTAPAPVVEDWPTPARPGGQPAGGDRASAPDGMTGPPAPAPAQVVASPVTVTHAGSVQSSPAAPVQPIAATPATGGRSAAAAAARAAAAGRSARQPVTGPPGAAAPAVGASTGRPASPGAIPAGNAGGSREAPPADEPPYDPDYDPPVQDPQYPGFDPGDEPTDEVVDERVIRESSEEQALRLLAEALGAEKIDDGRR